MVEELKQFREPRFAYILFETKQFRISGNGERTPFKSLAIMNVSGKPEVIHRVRYLLGKGFRILHYANFPEFGGAQDKVARLHSTKSGHNAWNILKGELHRELNLLNQVAAEAVQSYKDKVAELEAKLAKLEQPQTQGKNGPKTAAVGN